MTLIKSISGIRGTIGGAPGEGLTPVDAVKFAAAYGTWLKSKSPDKKLRVVIGRDEVKRCHEEVKTGESDSSFIKDLITSPLGETLIVLTSSLLLQKISVGASAR